MKVYTFSFKNNIEYYLSDDIYNEEPESFIGCSKTTRLIIEKKHLKEDEYICLPCPAMTPAVLLSSYPWKDRSPIYIHTSSESAVNSSEDERFGCEETKETTGLAANGEVLIV